MRWNMKSDAKEAAFSEMKKKTMPFKVKTHVVTNFMKAYLAVTNSAYAQELKNTQMYY